MTLLFASVCTSVAILFVRSLTWTAGFIMCYDGVRREQYRAGLRKRFVKAVRPYHEPQRDHLRVETQERNSPFGRAFARRIRPPSTAAKSGNPANSRKWVDTLARTGLVLSVPLLAATALAAGAAILHGAWFALLIEVVVALAANVVAWFAGLRAETRGPATTLGAMLLGAAVGGAVAGNVLCTIWSAGIARMPASAARVNG